MSLFQLLSFPRKITPSWTFSPGGVIWRMLPTSDGLLVGEARDEAEKKVTFFCVDLASGKVKWKDRSMSEDWWVGIETIHQGTVLLHLFARPDMPKHAGIIALDLASGALLWKDPRLQVQSVSEGRLYAKDPAAADERVHILSCETGETFEESSGEGRSVGEVPTAIPDPEGVLYPSILGAGDEGWNSFQSLIRGGDIIGECECARLDERWIFSYHDQRRQNTESVSFEQRIAVVEGSGKTIYSDIVHDNAHVPVYDSFFLQNSYLYYIRKERELVCVQVSPRET